MPELGFHEFSICMKKETPEMLFHSWGWNHLGKDEHMFRTEVAFLNEYFFFFELLYCLLYFSVHDYNSSLDFTA